MSINPNIWVLNAVSIYSKEGDCACLKNGDKSQKRMLEWGLTIHNPQYNDNCGVYITPITIVYVEIISNRFKLLLNNGMETKVLTEGVIKRVDNQEHLEDGGHPIFHAIGDDGWYYRLHSGHKAPYSQINVSVIFS